MGITHVKLLVYNELRDLTNRAHREVLQLASDRTNMIIRELELVGNVVGSGAKQSQLSNPRNRVAVYFNTTYKPYRLDCHKWYFLAEGLLLRRLTYSELGRKLAGSGLRSVNGDNTVLYVVEQEVEQQDRLVVDIMTALDRQ